MKMNKILLGLTAVLFAAGAAFASVKVSTSSSQTGWYRLEDENPFSCTELGEVDCNLEPTNNCLETIPGHGQKTIYSNSSCDDPLQREVGF